MAENGKLPASDLSPIARGELRHDAAAAWNAMNAHARRLGVELHPTGSMSSYRTYAQQVYLYGEYQAGRGSLAATPGTSNHGWGLAVDVATQEMRSIIDRIGREYGWSKTTSDAPSEWWHLKWVEGSWRGVDVGPYGQGAAPAPGPEPIQEGDMITAVVKQNGAIEVFVEKNDSGQVWHTWQNGPNSSWWGAEAGKNAKWQSLGTPGK
jgi:hypothetical protein